jgi:hypothetical protein
MKYFVSISMICIASSLLLSCGPNGPDGKDGKAFLTVTWNYGALNKYQDNNLSRVGAGSNWNLDQTYQVSPGTYSFEYWSRWYYPNGSFVPAHWWGTYVIWINKGQKGGSGKIFWQEGDPGKDGPDSYLTLYCNFDGWSGPRINKRIHGVPSIPDSAVVAEFYVGDYAMRVEYHLKQYGIVSDSSDAK